MKELNINSKIHGFILKENEFVKDINSKIQIFEHEKSGAKLMYIGNDDTNKTFSIGFKTPPTDDTGVMHILEHSVLCGSKNFPTKKPFVELCKSSLNTFLNAITYSDKTVYPVSSRNEKDFYNLMHVYLDAVFYPNIYVDDKIFRQEGWRYHIEKNTDDIIYNGVVYNEMKGALSSPLSQVVRKIEETLYPDNAYAFESGGDPKFIPNLTYEQFINTHKTLYHPSNSYITLYGDLDLEKTLEFIDSKYLSSFEKLAINVNIEKQSPFNKRVVKKFNYSVSDASQLENQDYLALNISIGDINDVELNIALNILTVILIYSEGAPLKQALIDEKLCDDVLGVYCSDVLQPYFSIILKGAKKENKDKFIEIVERTLSDLVNNGINKKSVKGCINVFEFKYREGEDSSTPKGLNYSLDAMASWIHGSSPIERLKFEKHFETIKKSLKEPYFENIISRYILNNPHSSLIILEPEMNLNQKDEEIVKEKLSNLKDSLSKDEIDNMVKKTKELIDYQNREDSEEALETIPSLSVEDLDKEVPDLKVDKYQFGKTEVYYHDIFTGGISYIDVQFNTKAVNEEDISYIGLLSNLLSRISTNSKNYVDLSNEIMCNLGGLTVFTKEYAKNNDIDNYEPVLNISCKALTNKTKTAIELITEIVNETNFEDTKRIKELIKEKISDLEIGIMSSGHVTATKRMSSYYNQLGIYQEKVNGLDYYKFLKNIDKNIDSNIEDLKKKLYEIKELIFNVNNMRVSVVGSNDEKNALLNNLELLQKSLPDNNVDYQNYTLKRDVLNEAILIPSDVQYVAKGYNFKKLGYDYHGSMEVLENILRYGYLWNNVRVKGGAYGAMISVSDYGNFTLCSYRDPNVKETIDIYKELPSFVENIEVSKKELEKAIIGTMSDKQLPLSPRAIGKYAISCALSNKTKEYRQKLVNEILATSIEDLKNHSKLIKDIMDIDCQTVTGNEKATEYTDLFNTIYNVLG